MDHLACKHLGGNPSGSPAPAGGGGHSWGGCRALPAGMDQPATSACLQSSFHHLICLAARMFTCVRERGRERKSVHVCVLTSSIS